MCDRTSALGAAMAALIVTAPAAAQELLLHLPFDGSLENNGSIPGEAQLYAKDDNFPPVDVAGKLGRALYFKYEAAVGLPYRLDLTQYPQLTVTAWIKQDEVPRAEREILSSANNFFLGVHGSGQLALRAGRNVIKYDQTVPKGEWVFVAGVIDMTNGTARIHQNDGWLPTIGLDKRPVAPKSQLNPDDPAADKQPYLTVGAHQFQGWSRSRRPMAIDDVRLYAGALSRPQIDELRGAAPPADPVKPPTAATPPATADEPDGQCIDNSQCAAGSYCARDDTCHPDSHRPKLELVVIDKPVELNVTLKPTADYFGDETFCDYSTDPRRTFIFGAAAADGSASPLSIYDPATEITESGTWQWEAETSMLTIDAMGYRVSLPVTQWTQEGFQWGPPVGLFLRGPCVSDPRSF